MPKITEWEPQLQHPLIRTFEVKGGADLTPQQILKMRGIPRLKSKYRKRGGPILKVDLIRIRHLYNSAFKVEIMYK